MRLSPHFTLAELTVSDTAKAKGIDNTPTSEHMANLRVTAHRMEAVRRILGRPIVPTSGYRNPQVNKLVGGVPTSDHAQGWAVDFKGTLAEARKLAERLDSFDQIILERNGTLIHVSFNPRCRMQCLTQRGAAGSSFEKGLVA